MFPVYSSLDDAYNDNRYRSETRIDNNREHENILYRIVMKYIRSCRLMARNYKQYKIGNYENIKSGHGSDSFVSRYIEFRDDIVKNSYALEICNTFFAGLRDYVDIDGYHHRIFPILYNVDRCSRDTLERMYKDDKTRSQSDIQYPSVECYGKKFIIVTSRSRGLTLSRAINLLPPDEILAIYLAILIILFGIEDGNIPGIIQFTHYDLHTENVIIDLDVRKIYSMELDGDIFQVEAYSISIIDLGMSYLHVNYDQTGEIELYDDYSSQSNLYGIYHPITDFNKITINCLADIQDRIDKDKGGDILQDQRLSSLYNLIRDFYLSIIGIEPVIYMYAMPSISEKSIKIRHLDIVRKIVSMLADSDNNMRDVMMVRLGSKSSRS